MNEFLLGGMKFNALKVLGWTIAWCFVLAGAATYAGLNGVPWRWQALAPYLLREARDSWLHNAFQIYALKSAEARAGKVAYIGGSVCLEGLQSDKLVSERLSQAAGREITFVSLCSPYQNFADEARIAAALGSSVEVVIFGTEPMFFAKGARRQFQAVAENSPKRSSGYFYLPIPGELVNLARRHDIDVSSFTDIGDFWLFGPPAIAEAARRARKSGPVVHARHRIREPRVLDYPKVVAGILERYRTHAPMNEALRGWAMHRLAAAGSRLVLVEIPLNRDYYHLFDGVRRNYDGILERLRKQAQFDYIEMQNADTWASPLFFDTHHLTAAGREVFMRLLVERLLPLLKPTG